MSLGKALSILSLLLLFVLSTSSTVLSQTGPERLYFKNGKQITCDQVWEEGDTLFVVPHGKRYAISYDKKEVDLQRSFVRILERNSATSPTATQETTTPERSNLVVTPQIGNRPSLTIHHDEYSLAPKSHEPKTKRKDFEGPKSPNPTSNASNAIDQRGVGGSGHSDTPSNYEGGKDLGRSGMAEPKRLQDSQTQGEANRNYEQEYQKKLREYEAAKRKNEQEYQQKLREYDTAKRNNEQEYQQKLKEYEAAKRQVEANVKQELEQNERARQERAAAEWRTSREYGRKPYLEDSYPDMMRRGSGYKPYLELDKSYPAAKYNGPGRKPYLENSYPEMMYRNSAPKPSVNQQNPGR